MSKYLSKRAQNLVPYTYGEQPKDKQYVKLNTNENPYPVSPKAIKAMDNYPKGDLRLYSNPACEELISSIADFYNLKPENVYVSNSSDEVLALAHLAFFDKGDKTIFADVTYSFYPVYANLFQNEAIVIPLNDDFSVPLEKFTGEAKGILLPNPNAPTGLYVELDEIEKLIINNRDKIVIIDEAYVDFGGESAAKFVDKYDNLLVVQTFSKSRSLAGLRVGFALGNKGLIEGLNRIKNSFNPYSLDSIALIGATEAMKDKEYFIETRDKIIKTRDWTTDELTKLGFNVIPSKANFVFASPKDNKAKEIFTFLKENGVLVRYWEKGRVSNYLRISIGTDNDMKILIDTIKKFYN